MADTGENKNKDRAEHAKPQLRLGLKPNINQFLLLILVNAFVGAMIGLEQTVVPLLGKEEFGLESNVLRKENTRIITTLSQYFDREMILADECLLRGDESGAAVYSHIANVIHTAMKELEELEE